MLTGDHAVLVSRIRTIDGELDALERETRDSVIRGLHSSGAALMTNLQQAAADDRHARLLAERADLVEQLRRSVEGS